MSKTIRTKVYSFTELDETAQKRALEQCRDIEVRHEWWDLLYDDFGSLCETFGVDVYQKETYFRGFYSQGDGVAISADIDLRKLVEGIEGKVWEKEWGEEITKALDFAACPVDKRVLKLIYNGNFEISCSLIPETQFAYYTKLSFEYWADNKTNIAIECDKLELWLHFIAKSLESYFYDRLEKEYEWRKSDESVAEGIKANDYWFTKDGKLF